MDVLDGFASIDNGRLYYEVAGEGPALVLIPGFGVDRRMWDDQVGPLSERYRVVRYDPRGFGLSSAPDGPYFPPDDLQALLDHLDIGQAHILGLSRGGGTAIDFVLSHPDRALSLIMVDAILGGHRWQGRFGDDVRTTWALAETAPLDAVREHWLSLPLFETALRQPALAARVRTMVYDYSGWHWRNDDPDIRLRPPAAKRLADVRVPTLVVVGELDLPDFHQVADVVAQGVPGAQKVVLLGVGHMASMEDPAQFNALVLDFLASV